MHSTRNIVIKSFASLAVLGCLIGMPLSSIHAATPDHLIAVRIPAIQATGGKEATKHGSLHTDAKHDPFHVAADRDLAHNLDNGSQHRSGHGSKGASKHGHKRLDIGTF